MARGSGKDAVAAQANTTASTSPDTDATANPTQIFTRAVVVEVLYDLSVFPEEDLEEMKALIGSPEMLATAPRNSVIARIVTAGADKKSPEASKEATDEEKRDAQENSESLPEGEKVGGVGILCYPFFPPHLCFPIKPGEQVWVVQDSPDAPNKIQYWMCRIPEPAHVDDINFTHADRKLVGSLAPPSTKDKAENAQATEGTPDDGTTVVDPGTETTAEGQAENPLESEDKDGDGMDDRIFGFPNGTGKEDAYTLKEELAYEDMVNIAIAYDQFHKQHVPRFTKRPGDLVMQGSNNTLICLGEQRGWGRSEGGERLDLPWDAEFSNATFDEEKIESRKDYPWGAIDIVAGRGRYDWRMRDQTELLPPILTAPRCILNTPIPEHLGPGREAWVETNKNPQGNEEAELNRLDAPCEGDPDFAYDAARLWVSQSGEVDALFNIDVPGTTLPTLIGPEDGDLLLTNKDYPSAVVAKGDEVRIIARKLEADDPVDGAPEINGSIRLIKQGTPDDDMACIYLLSNGTVQISGSKIFLGRHPDDGGLGEDNSGPGDGSSQPYVMYQQLYELLNEAFSNISSFCDTLLGHVTPGYGAPSPQINQAAAALKGDMGSRQGQIPTIMSERIFGE
jgi:hypothetical protein